MADQSGGKLPTVRQAALRAKKSYRLSGIGRRQLLAIVLELTDVLEHEAHRQGRVEELTSNLVVAPQAGVQLLTELFHEYGGAPLEGQS